MIPRPTASPASPRRSSPAPRSSAAFAAPRLRGLFHRRTSALIAATAVSALALAGMGLFESFWVVVGLVVVWGLLFAATEPIRQTYINGMIPSRSAPASSPSTR